jgi:hypothetical protein
LKGTKENREERITMSIMEDIDGIEPSTVTEVTLSLAIGALKERLKTTGPMLQPYEGSGPVALHKWRQL